MAKAKERTASESVDPLAIEEAPILTDLKKKGEEIKWKDRNDIIDKIPVSGGSGWADVVVAERKSDKKRYLRMRRALQGYNIWTAEDLAGIIEALKAGSQAIGWDTEDQAALQMAQEMKALKEMVKSNSTKYLERIRDLSTKMAELREKHLKLELPKFKEELKQFKKLLDSAPSEHAVQEYLEKHTWLFGLDYLDQQPEYFSQFNLQGDKFDFMLQRYDTFYDIFEIKKPTAELFINKSISPEDLLLPSRKSPISGDLKDAISQMIEYLESAELWSKDLYFKNGLLLLKPKGIIVIGRTKSNEKRAIKTLNYYFNHFEVLTYDDLIKKAEEFVNRLEKRKIKQ